nr:putative ribonuclease H-like domain-containing protein [Tanacetum cinerariifolium]
MWDPPFRRGLSPGKESLTSLPQRRFLGDKLPGKGIPSDKSPGKALECRWGKPLMLPPYTRANVFLTIVDDYSRVRCDNDGEFTSNSMITFYKKNGILLETTCPYTPQQNGVVERKHIHLLETMSADVARSHGDDGRGKGKRKPNLGGRAAGRLNTRDKIQNLSLKEIMDTRGPGMPLYYPSWLKAPKERMAALITDIGHLQKAYNTNKAALKAQHWVMDPTTETYNVEKIRRERPENITASVWDKYIKFWNDPRNIARAAQNRQNRAKSTVISRQRSWSLARLRDEMDRRIYEEMRRLEAMGTYTDDEITRLVREGKQRGHIAGMGRVLPARAIASPSTPTHDSTLNSLHKKVDFMMSIFK